MTGKRIGAALITMGFLLLLTAIVGHFTAMGDYRSEKPREWEDFDAELAADIRSWSELSVEAERRVASSGEGDQAVMMALYGLVTERFTHRAARHTFFSNWLLAAMGALNPAFSHIRVPETMVRRGHSLLCGQSSYVLLRLAQEHDIPTRHVGLVGHVVMEAWYEDEWHLFDPDLEVVPRDDDGGVLSVEEVAKSSDLLQRFYGVSEGTYGNASMVEILASRENNTYMSYPPGAWFEWKSNVLFWFEKLAEIMKFVLPLILVCLGLWLVRLRACSAASKSRI